MPNFTFIVVYTFIYCENISNKLKRVEHNTSKYFRKYKNNEKNKTYQTDSMTINICAIDKFWKTKRGEKINTETPSNHAHIRIPRAHIRIPRALTHRAHTPRVHTHTSFVCFRKVCILLYLSANYWTRFTWI